LQIPWSVVILRAMPGFNGPAIDRRTFLFAGFVTAAGLSSTEQSPRLETFTEWLSATASARERALPACLDRIRAMDPSIHAWVQVAPEKPTGTGKLSGIPFGVKDIIETRGLSTAYGSPVYKGRIGTDDAAIVRELRARGAIVLGKTDCTAFAHMTPAATRNPRNLEHTPGGSSSGSAAAVAAGMVPFAIGTQTRGSVLRPASFCGVTGFKPTYGLLSMEGVLQLAKSWDTLGFFTNTPTDMLALWDSMGHPTASTEDSALGVPEPRQEVDPAMAAAFENALIVLQKAGATIRPLDIAGTLAKLSEANKAVMFYEGARFHEQRYKEFGSRLDPAIVELIQQGLAMSTKQYDEDLQFVAACKPRFSEIFKTTPVILTPAAPGPAPLGLASTGDPRMNAPWTSLGTPAITIPMPVSSGLPLGLQITAEHGQDSRVLAIAVHLYEILTSASAKGSA
jgi:Asp-tRNA(Asn)/Glu-tRNA(Gln) amidotransferase A subunit family amidase